MNKEKIVKECDRDHDALVAIREELDNCSMFGMYTKEDHEETLFRISNLLRCVGV